MTTDRPPVWRHEYKHWISPQEDWVLARRLEKLFEADRHAGPGGVYRVNSLYFDTPADTALRQKLDGVDRREKFRLRYYGQDTGFLRLEKKSKKNGLCQKLSARLSEEEVRLLLAGQIDFLLHSGQPLLVELYTKMRAGLRPRTAVCYDRQAFVSRPGNVRITLGRDLRRGPGPAAFLDPEALACTVAPGGTILEVKYDAFLPDLVRMAVQVPGRRAGAWSKYAACRKWE